MLTRYQASYTDIRQALLHKGLGKVEGHELPDNAEDLPWDDIKSTKLSLALDIVKYHLGRTCTPPLIPEETGFRQPTSKPEGYLHPPNALPDKMFLYLAWPGENWLIRKALEESGITFMEVNGQDTPQKRATKLNEFRNATNMFACLLSNVGLNLAFANIMIVVDNLWSVQDYKQLVSRLWPHRQK